MSPVRHETNQWGQITDGHLGGYIPGGDPNTQYPILWNWLIDEWGVESVLDVGCGDGAGALEFFADRDCTATGIDGIDNGREGIYVHDFTTGPFSPGVSWDLIWCCEFVEHVEEQYVPNFLAAFAHADLLLMTHATPGQGGHHHVNEQPSSYWIKKMNEIGYSVDFELTLSCRELAGAEPIHPNMNYFAKTGLAFRRKP